MGLTRDSHSFKWPQSATSRPPSSTSPLPGSPSGRLTFPSLLLSNWPTYKPTSLTLPLRRLFVPSRFPFRLPETGHSLKRLSLSLSPSPPPSLPRFSLGYQKKSLSLLKVFRTIGREGWSLSPCRRLVLTLTKRSGLIQQLIPAS